MRNSNLDLARIARVLAAHEVDYVVIGGLAIILRGGQTSTEDVDISFSMHPDNFEKLADALQELNARPKRWLTPNYRLRSSDFGTVWLHLESDAGDIDLITRTPGVSYQELRDGSDPLPIEGFELCVASKSDLLRIKKEATRDKDRWHVAELERLIETEEGESS